MNFLQGNRAALLGVALIVVTNAVILGGVAWNRSGAPESELILSPRELSPDHEWSAMVGDKDGGLVLSLKTQMAGLADYYSYTPRNSEPDSSWVTREKLYGLGYDLPALADVNDILGNSRRQIDRQPSRKAFVVLELDGAAYRALIERTHKWAEEERARVVADDAKAARQNDIDHRIEWVSQRDSRLFVVDVGVDPKSLRTRFPDRTHYAIVPARIKPWLYQIANRPQYGLVVNVLVPRITMPRDLTRDWQAKDRSHATSDGPAQIRVAFGRRFEPWIVGVQEQDTDARH